MSFLDVDSINKDRKDTGNQNCDDSVSDKEKHYSFNTNSSRVPESCGVELNMMTINEGGALDNGGEPKNNTFSFNSKDDGCKSDLEKTYGCIADSPKTKNNNAHKDNNLNNSTSASGSKLYNQSSGKPSDIKENIVNHDNVTFICAESTRNNVTVEDGVASQDESGKMAEGSALLNPPVFEQTKRMNSTNSTGNHPKY